MHRFCRNCGKSTEHREIRRNAFGEEDESFVSRAFFGVFSFGMTEMVADYLYECQECGRTVS